MKWLKSILSKDGELSSKRVCGVAGWIVILTLYCYSGFTGKALPDMGELLIACVALLGVDSIASVFNKGQNDSI